MRSVKPLPSCLVCSRFEDKGEARLKGIWLVEHLQSRESEKDRHWGGERYVEARAICKFHDHLQRVNFTVHLLSSAEVYVSPPCGCSWDHTQNTTEHKQNTALTIDHCMKQRKPTWLSLFPAHVLWKGVSSWGINHHHHSTHSRGCYSDCFLWSLWRRLMLWCTE